MDEVKVGVEMTPNPNSLKFVVTKEILPSGTIDFSNAEKAKGSALLEALFEIPHVVSLLAGRNFITISKEPEADWEEMVPDLFHAMKRILEGPGPYVAPELLPQEAEKSANTIEQKIIDVLDREVRPAVARDGGDIIFDSYEDGVVRLHLQGACSSCPSSIMTLKMGVETRLKQLIPEIREVIQV